MIPLLAACASVEYRYADLQLDLDGSVPETAATTRVCVQEQGEHEEGTGNGRIAVQALRADLAAVVRVEVYDEAGEQLLITPSVTLDAEHPYELVVPDAPDGVVCETGGGWAREDEDAWLLAVRFSDW